MRDDDDGAPHLLQLLEAVAEGDVAVQLNLNETELRRSSLAEAAHYIESHLQIDPDGTVRLPSAPGSSWATFGYPSVMFDRDGQILFQRPRDLDRDVIAALYTQGLPTDGATRRGTIRFFNMALGEQHIIGAALQTGSAGARRVIEVFKDENAPDVLVDDMIREFPLPQRLGIGDGVRVAAGGRRGGPVAPHAADRGSRGDRRDDRAADA
jgi:hypothetical protein